jgi:hypothetical protein
MSFERQDESKRRKSRAKEGDLRSSGMLSGVASLLLMFRDNPSFPSQMVKQLKKKTDIGCPETSLTTNLHCVISEENDDLIYTVAVA